MYSDYVYKWLETALDCGITEQQYWNMTIAEVKRAVDSRNRLEKIRQQERATYDYIQADLIGRSIARVYNSANKMPDISAVYPTLFDSKEIAQKKAQKSAELSALRFKQFAQSFNKRLGKGAAKGE